MGLPGEWGYWAMIIFSIVCLGARLILLKEMLPQFSSFRYIRDVLYPIIRSIIPVFLLVLLLHRYITEINILSFMLESMECLFFSLVSLWFIGLTRLERSKAIAIIEQKLLRRKNCNNGE